MVPISPSDARLVVLSPQSIQGLPTNWAPLPHSGEVFASLNCALCPRIPGTVQVCTVARALGRQAPPRQQPRFRVPGPKPGNHGTLQRQRTRRGWFRPHGDRLSKDLRRIVIPANIPNAMRGRACRGVSCSGSRVSGDSVLTDSSMPGFGHGPGIDSSRRRTAVMVINAG